MTQQYDLLLQKIVDYTLEESLSLSVIDDAYLCLLDALGCAALSLEYDSCVRFLAPLTPALTLHQGCRVVGCKGYVNPITAAFNLTAMIRWLDYNDTWLGEEWGHPSDCLGALFAAADYANQYLNTQYTIKDLSWFLVKSYEIQGLLAQENAFNRVGIDHVAFLKIAVTVTCSVILGLDREACLSAVSNACVDGHALRTYRHFPNTCSRKSWAAADAVAKALQLAFWAKKGMVGIASALTAANWGVYDVFFQGKAFSLPQEFGSFVVKNILFKVPFAAEYHSVTAIECACKLHKTLKGRLDSIDTIHIETQAAGKRIIDKEGVLKNPADRDHCLQYIVAVALVYGEVYPHHFEDSVAQNPMIDYLRNKMTVCENKQFTQAYLDINCRSCSNKITIHFQDDKDILSVQVDFPLGHVKRRAEAIPKLIEKYQRNIQKAENKQQFEQVLEKERFLDLPVHRWLALSNK